MVVPNSPSTYALLSISFVFLCTARKAALPMPSVSMSRPKVVVGWCTKRPRLLRLFELLQEKSTSRQAPSPAASFYSRGVAEGQDLAGCCAQLGRTPRAIQRTSFPNACPPNYTKKFQERGCSNDVCLKGHAVRGYQNMYTSERWVSQPRKSCFY